MSQLVPSTALPFIPAVALPAGVSAPALHHIEGAPVRAAVCDAGLFAATAPAGGGPARAPIYDQLERRLWELPGAYCLVWNPGGARPIGIYVGSCGDFFGRLVGHPRTGWTHAILLTGHGVGRAGAEQAETALGSVLMAATPRSELDKKWTKHPRPWGADMPWHLFEPLVVLLDQCLNKIGVNVTLDPRVARL